MLNAQSSQRVGAFSWAGVVRVQVPRKHRSACVLGINLQTSTLVSVPLNKDLMPRMAQIIVALSHAHHHTTWGGFLDLGVIKGNSVLSA